MENSYSYYSFSEWGIDPIPSYPVNLSGSLVLSMDQDYVVSAGYTLQTYQLPSCKRNAIQLLTASSIVVSGEKFTTDLGLLLETQNVAAYGFAITYDPEIITPDISKGNKGVVEGAGQKLRFLLAQEAGAKCFAANF